MTQSIIALIPARVGSKRVPGKNTRLLAGHPLLAYTVVVAKESGIFQDIYVATDSEDIISIGVKYGAQGFLRSVAIDDEPDIRWVSQFFDWYKPRTIDTFAILRPTSPFRTAGMIQRAWALFQANDWVDSIRAVEEWHGFHPGKMWRLSGNSIISVMPDCYTEEAPFHSSPTQILPAIYRQNASLEMARVAKCLQMHTIAGTEIMPFFTHGYEGFDINTEDDWYKAEELVTSGQAVLPAVLL